MDLSLYVLLMLALWDPLSFEQIDLIRNFDRRPESLAQQGSAHWFDAAKLGIFIHWGPYSIPAFANPKADESLFSSYAEW